MWLMSYEIWNEVIKTRILHNYWVDHQSSWPNSMVTYLSTPRFLLLANHLILTKLHRLTNLIKEDFWWNKILVSLLLTGVHHQTPCKRHVIWTNFPVAYQDTIRASSSDHWSELPSPKIPETKTEIVSFLWENYIHWIIPTISIVHVKTGLEINRITIFWIFSIFYPFYGIHKRFIAWF